jgi:hypothetical protein
MTDHKSDLISPDEEELSEAQLPAAREQMQARLTELFRRTGAQEPTRRLFDTLARYRSGET